MDCGQLQSVHRLKQPCARSGRTACCGDWISLGLFLQGRWEQQLRPNTSPQLCSRFGNRWGAGAASQACWPRCWMLGGSECGPHTRAPGALACGCGRLTAATSSAPSRPGPGTLLQPTPLRLGLLPPPGLQQPLLEEKWSDPPALGQSQPTQQTSHCVYCGLFDMQGPSGEPGSGRSTRRWVDALSRACPALQSGPCCGHHE